MKDCLCFLVFVLLCFTCVVAKPRFEDLSNDAKQKRDIFFSENSELDENKTINIASRKTFNISTPKCNTDAVLYPAPFFCENLDFYPYYEIKQILKRNKVPLFFFGADDPPKNDPTNRLGDNEGHWFLCNSESKVIRPRIAINKKNQWRLIVNQENKDGFIQAIRIEICKNPDSPCRILGDLPNGDMTICKQKYVYRTLISIDEGGKPIPDMFRLPSACSCAYKKGADFLKNFGRRNNR